VTERERSRVGGAHERKAALKGLEKDVKVREKERE
jgi:hypothetical protein